MKCQRLHVLLVPPNHRRNSETTRVMYGRRVFNWPLGERTCMIGPALCCSCTIRSRTSALRGRKLPPPTRQKGPPLFLPRFRRGTVWLRHCRGQDVWGPLIFLIYPIDYKTLETYCCWNMLKNKLCKLYYPIWSCGHIFCVAYLAEWRVEESGFFYRLVWDIPCDVNEGEAASIECLKQMIVYNEH